MSKEAEYYQAKSVLDSPNDYDGRMVTDARNYVRGYEDAESQLKAKMPTDEEIKEHFRTQHSHYKDGRYYKTNLHRIAGAKWLKQQIIKP